MSDFICYLIQSERTGTCYVGMTNNFPRRLRQHNGELVGGAKRTHNRRPWKPVVTVHGFHNKIQALQFEWRFAKGMPRGWSLNTCLRRLEIGMGMVRWTSNSPLAASVPLTLTWRTVGDDTT